MKNWPPDAPSELRYRRGEKPLFEYLRGNAKDYPDRPAIFYYGKEISWADLDLYTDRFASFLASKGLKKGDRVMLYLQNCPQYVIAHYGIQKLGCIVVPANPMFKQMELEYEANDAGIGVIVTSDDLYSNVEQIREKTGIEEVVVSNYRDLADQNPPYAVPEELTHKKQQFDGTHEMLDIITTHGTDYQHPEINIDEDVSLITYTSGSTGRPKGAMLTFRNALFKAACGSEFNQFVHTDVMLGVMPICHIAGNLFAVGMSVYSGAAVISMTRFEPDAVLPALQQHGCTIFYGVTPMLLALMGHPEASSSDLTSIRLTQCTSFGIAFTEEIANKWSDFVGGCPAVEAGYGLSETHTGDVSMPPHKPKYGPTGIPTFDTDFRIINPGTGEEVPVGEEGEIIVRNQGVFKGYLEQPEKTEETLRDGWVFTGDVGRFDEDGYLYFLGRTKEMIKCSGFSVFPEDVEAMLIKHPAVFQVAIIGVPDDVRGESVKAFIVLHPEAKGQVTEEEIISWARENMAAYKYPRQVVFRDTLPATGAGKVLRRLLKDE